MDYNKPDIKKLLEKYFDGQTSLEEEKTLKKYLASGQEDRSDDAAARMFGYFSGEKEVRHPAAKRKPKRRVLYSICSSAASIAIIIALSLTIWKQDKGMVYCYINGEPVTDRELAVEQAEATFDMVSKSINRTFDEIRESDVASKLESLFSLTENTGGNYQ